MSTTQRHINTFRGGQKEGIDRSQQNQNTYTRSVNGRVVFNPDGTWAWTNTKGTKIVFQLAANYGNPAVGYEIIGSDYVNGTLIIYSTNNVNSEIGLVRQNSYNNFTYQTSFNDLYDPFGNKLRFSKQFNIVSDAVQENNVIERSYWNDDRNEPRAFNFVAGAVNPALFTSGPYMPIGAVMGVPASFIGKIYPSFYSVHGISQVPDLTWGLIKYQKNIPGTLKSGQRQYFYRYIHQTGYASPWSYGTDFIMMSSKNVDNADWTKYDMGASGLVTSKGHQIEIKYLDQRFQKVEVACLYWETEAAATEATIVFQGNITGPNIIVTHTSDAGQKITIDELVQKFFNIKKAKTQAIHRDNFYHLGNVELYPDLPIDTLGITVEPLIKKMISDQSAEVNTTPLTHQVPTANDTVTKRLFSGAGGNIDEQYMIVDDYINYKGTQWAHQFKGHFRQETYPWAIVIWNRKGQPLFAQHISDYTLPKQHDNIFFDARNTGLPPVTGTVGALGDYVLTDYTPGDITPITDNIVQGNNIVLKTLGMQFGNIDLTPILFDANGDLQVSGFSIVRMDRLGIILAQGILCNTVRESTGGNDYTDQTRPLPTSYNYLVDASVGVGTSSTIGINWKNAGCNEIQLNPRGFWHTFEAPDYFIDNNLFETSSVSDKIELIGGCHPAFRAAGLEDNSKELAGNHGHFYGKNYHTPYGGWTSILDALNPVAASNFGNQYQVDRLFANARSIGSILGALSWTEYSSIAKYLSLAGITYFDATCAKNQYSPFNAITHHLTVLLGLSLNTCSLKNGDHHCSHYIVNYLKSVATSAINQSLLENRVYHNIGHFVPINATTLAAAKNGNNYIFNEVQVWGGDCYVDYFGLARMVPLFAFPDGNGSGYDHAGECGHHPIQQAGARPDYAIGIIFPLESKFNHTMRSGDSYPKVGTKPMNTYCGDENTFADGIYFESDDDENPEDFNVNKVLQAQDLLSQYNAKKLLLNPDVTDFPLMEIYAGAKFYGEQYDAYRRFLINNFQFANGKFGEITAIRELFGELYVYQRQSVAKIRFNEREIISTAAGGAVATGTGTGYGGHDYISTEFGSQHQFSMVSTGKAHYWMDAEKGKMLRFAQDGVSPISDVEDARWIGPKLREYWYANGFEFPFYDNPSYIGGIHGTYDFKNSAVVFTFTQRRENGNVALVGEAITIEYSEVNSAFATYHTFTPRWYMKMKQNYLSMQPDVVNPNVYMHEEGIKGQIYGANHNSSLKFVVNPNSTYAKVFDNSELNVDGAVEIVSLATGVTNIIPAQAVVLNNAVVDNRPIYREGKLTFPIMQKGQRVRLRGEYLELEFLIANGGNDKSVNISQHTTLYRISSRV